MNKVLRSYPSYKPSGLPWLGEIPEHWEVRRNGGLFSQRNDTGHSHLPILEVSLKTGVRVRDMENAKRKQVMSDPEKYKLARQGDIAYNMMRMWQGAVGVAPVDGLVSPAYVVACPFPEVESRYYTYLFRTDAYMHEVNKYSHGIVADRNRLYWDEFKQMPSALPPLEEQIAIANFLDQYGYRVARFIRNKRRLIELLNEQKQGIINQAVTRGLDPDVRMKDSGVEWLGEVPEHWIVSRIKTEFDCLNRTRIPLSSVERGEMKSRTYDYYGASGVIDKVDDYLFDDDLLLIAEDGANLVLRNLPLAIIARGKFWVNNHAHILRPKNGCLEYFAHLLETIDYSIWITGAAQPKLTQDRLMAVPIPAPSLVEQEQILAFISQATIPLDTAISRIQREIDLIREYRTRLIADVVTGKVDVRGLAAELPAELEGVEEFEEDPEEVAELEDASEDM